MNIADGRERDYRRVVEGDLVLLVGNDRKEAIVRLLADGEFQSHHGVLPHAEVIGQPWGGTVTTHLGYEYMVLPPSLDQLVRDIQRMTQIIYPKETGYLLMKMNIGPGTRILEAGTGSGGLTLVLARMVMPHGHVYSYEARPEIQALARRNLERVGLAEYVTFKVRDAAEGFDEEGVDAVFLDVREPWRYLTQVHRAVKGGGFFGCLLPTVNQVSILLRHLERPYSSAQGDPTEATQARPFGFVEVEELLLRPYKAVPARLRPFDRMVAHTGYLVFARALLAEQPGTRPQPDAPGYPGEEQDIDESGYE